MNPSFSLSNTRGLPKCMFEIVQTVKHLSQYSNFSLRWGVEPRQLDGNWKKTTEICFADGWCPPGRYYEEFALKCTRVCIFYRQFLAQQGRCLVSSHRSTLRVSEDIYPEALVRFYRPRDSRCASWGASNQSNRSQEVTVNRRIFLSLLQEDDDMAPACVDEVTDKACPPGFFLRDNTTCVSITNCNCMLPNGMSAPVSLIDRWRLLPLGVTGEIFLNWREPYEKS